MHETQLAPVVLFVYNRPDHTMRLLKSLNRAAEAEQTKLFVFSDSAKDERTQEQVKAVRDCVAQFMQKESRFQKVEVKEASKNRGLAQSIISGVTEIIREYGRVIVLEDDLEVSSDFLNYMNGALDFYEDKSDIWAISGYTFPMKAFQNYPHDVYLSGRGCSWGWATWQDRWETVDWEVKDYPVFKHNLVKRHAFARWGRDLPEMLDAYMYGEIHSWAIRWCYEAFKQGRLTVYPTVSRVLNGGTDGSGTNFRTMENRYNTELKEIEIHCRFENCEINRRIQREFAKKYATPVEKIKIKLRWLFIRINVIKPKNERDKNRGSV